MSSQPCLSDQLLLKRLDFKVHVHFPGEQCSVCCAESLSNVQFHATLWILQAIILEWIAISFSRDLPNPGVGPASLCSPALAGGFFTPDTTCLLPNMGLRGVNTFYTVQVTPDLVFLDPDLSIASL